MISHGRICHDSCRIRVDWDSLNTVSFNDPKACVPVIKFTSLSYNYWSRSIISTIAMELSLGISLKISFKSKYYGVQKKVLPNSNTFYIFNDNKHYFLCQFQMTQIVFSSFSSSTCKDFSSISGSHSFSKTVFVSSLSFDG